MLALLRFHRILGRGITTCSRRRSHRGKPKLRIQRILDRGSLHIDLSGDLVVERDSDFSASSTGDHYLKLKPIVENSTWLRLQRILGRG